MPTIKNISGPYRLCFYSFDCNEPKHVHIQRERMVCKYWLDPVTLAANHGYSAGELNIIRRLVSEKLNLVKGAWNEHCGHPRTRTLPGGRISATVAAAPPIDIHAHFYAARMVVA